MTDRTPVLVVGAGPAGLVVACELLRLGVPVRVVDAEPVPGTGSRAILLWPPALDVLRELGVLEQAEAQGLRARAMAYHMGDGKVLRVELAESDQPLLLPQERTGMLLLDALHRLGGKVERPLRLTGVEETADGVAAYVAGPDGGTQTIVADWLIGADGVGSAVRRELGVEFPGAAIPTTFLLAEGELTGEIDRTQMTYYLGGKGVLLLAPLPDGVVRLSGPVPAGAAPTEELAQQLLDQRGPGGLRMRVTTGAWTFESQERIAGALRTGRSFLVGDAAHVHSVVGGQGLNLGVQDGRNLAWKLAGVIRGRLSPAVLDSYDPERRAAAEQVLKATGRMAKQAVAGPAASRVRNVVWTLLDRTGRLRSWYGPMLAGRRVRYPDVLFGRPWAEAAKAVAPTRRLRPLPRAGTRPPGWLPARRTDRFRLVTTGGLAGAGRELADRLPAAVEHEQVPRSGSVFVLIRPDGVVAAAGGTAEELRAAGDLLAELVSP
jgi:2-polyprenyl-6-methoxyphenol hydroxylase-like FAD-dependent oxidoreductase